MTKQRSAWPAACFLALAAGLNLWAWTLDALPLSRFLLRALLLPALWGYVEMVARSNESVTSEILGLHRYMFAVFGAFWALRAGLGLAFDLHLLGIASVPMARRGVGAIFGGLMLAWGNRLPKIMSPWTLDQEPFDWQRVHRFIGWLVTVAGAGVAVGWLTLPLGQAARLQNGIVLGSVVVAMAVKLSSVVAHARRGPSLPLLLAGALLTVPWTAEADGTRLAGTLTIPEGDGPFPAALLISGAGAQDRDYPVLGHRPFLVLADYLGRRGIAVLRVDDRGTGGSAGDLSTAQADAPDESRPTRCCCWSPRRPSPG